MSNVEVVKEAYNAIASKKVFGDEFAGDKIVEVVKRAYDAIAELDVSGDVLAGDELQAFEKFLSRVSGNNVIDLGCGQGRLAKHVFEKIGANVVGYDLSSKNISIANSKNKYPNNITFNVSDMQTVSSDVLFDAAILSFSLIHLTHDQAVATLNNLFNLLRENAEVYISVSMGKTVGYRPEPVDENVMTFVKLYTEDEIRGILKSCGYQIAYFFFGEDINPTAFAKDSMFIIAHKSCQWREEK